MGRESRYPFLVIRTDSGSFESGLSLFFVGFIFFDGENFVDANILKIGAVGGAVGGRTFADAFENKLKVRIDTFNGFFDLGFVAMVVMIDG